MKPVKFRAFTKKQKEMEYDVYIKPDGMVYKDVDKGIRFHTVAWIPQNVEVMQFTGLKDKDGKEIWEGDVVKIETYKTGKYQNENVVVTFAMGQFGFWGEPLRNFNTHCEIIGNLYENPELVNP